MEFAAIELTEEEAIYFLKQLNIQLTAIHEMDLITEIETTTPITTHGIRYTTMNTQFLREDVAKVSSYADSILAQMPETKSRYVVTPSLPLRELE